MTICQDYTVALVDPAVVVSIAFWAASIPLHPPATYILWGPGSPPRPRGVSFLTLTHEA
ncbi:hypothetical protein [Streptomyces sp. NPDC001820]|uniref:hypothetical protein n=1 Tax=Streptomyces sp. NPDC001820 TaxID=3364613 RepID=UPI0036A03E5E